MAHIRATVATRKIVLILAISAKKNGREIKKLIKKLV